ncbi:hypothetical protein [Mucilaginibacter antarcticus]|uniref:hypothetical protein n=1 Tax=Mucilaginibacter antarcticus TaxID=1855725 RepID=UPI00363722F4
MQNFGEDTFYSQRLYLGLPAEDAWLVKSEASVARVNGQDVLKLDLKLNRPDNILSPVALKKVQVKVMELRTEAHQFQTWIYREELQTGLDGSIKINTSLKEKLNGRRMRVELITLDKNQKYKLIRLPLLLNRNQNIDLQFLPESGHLVAGIKSKVAFKALDEEGAGISVSGTLLDSLGNKITSFISLRNGMGAFEFMPEYGKAYFATLNQSGDKKYPLPKAKAQGTVMQINNPEQSEIIAINLSGIDALGTDTACYIVGTTRGTIYYSQTVQANLTKCSVAKNLFPTGIARFTLFKGLRPLNERRVFIDHHDQLNINISPNKTIYNKHDSVSLDIEVKTKSGFPVQGNFSLAVTDDSQVKSDSLGNNGILAGLLLNTEIKGSIETPAYYINRKDKDAWLALDNLMLTQGWTAYDWKDVFAAPPHPNLTPKKILRLPAK